MVVQTARSVARSSPASLIVATDDQRIVAAVEAAGFTALMTRTDHPSGSDRVLEVADRLGWADDSIVINVQGDEPLMPPEVISQLADALAEGGQWVATLCERLDSSEDVFNPNIVKVVSDRDQNALYFSRAPIPWRRSDFSDLREKTGIPLADGAPGWFRHLGIYGWRLAMLRRFVSLPTSGLEQTESLEQLRLLEAGIRIRVLQAVMSVPGGVDTAADLERVNRAAADLR
jgi:3-deoxy-manno-octulosonate cytidylyltransferase (CMP-KDO synthetase)